MTPGLMQNALKMQEMSDAEMEKYYKQYSAEYLKILIEALNGLIACDNVHIPNYKDILRNRIRIIEKVIEGKMK